MPPRMTIDAITSRNVTGSPSNKVPPAAAMTGTLGCTVAALVAFNPANAVYQMA